jgi:hypothetical protein
VPLLLQERLPVRELSGPQNPARLMIQAGQVIGKLLLSRVSPLVKEVLRRRLPGGLLLKKLGEEGLLIPRRGFVIDPKGRAGRKVGASLPLGLGTERRLGVENTLLYDAASNPICKFPRSVQSCSAISSRPAKSSRNASMRWCSSPTLSRHS